MSTNNKPPKMSVNKLGEYLVASPKRQRRILEELKYPKENIFATMPQYEEARKAIKNYFVNDFDENIILDTIDNLNERNDETDFQKSLTKSATEALELVLESEQINNEPVEYQIYDGDNPKVNIEGVEISVNPDIIVKSTVRKKEYVGALKIHLSKSGKFGEEGGKYIGAVLQQFVEEHVKQNGELSRNTHCVSYDVFTDSFIKGPKAVIKIMGEIEAGCKNIVAIWDSI